MATVSIIIPTFNRSKLLAECVNSLLAQNYAGMEIIVVDDGSTDDTNSTVLEITQKHKNVRYYSRPHLGAPAARNFGLANAAGEFICFFDSDDLWPADYIETMVNALKASPDFGAVYSRITRYNNGEIAGQYGSMVNPPCGFITADLFSGKPFILPSSTIFRKDVWTDIFWDEALKNRQDFDMFLRISTRTKFMYVPKTHTLHRKHNNCISAAAGKDVFDNGPGVMERFYFRLGGSAHLPKRKAFRDISHRYRHFAKRNLRAGNRAVSMTLLKRAIYYCPLDLRLYVNLYRAFLLNRGNDKMPGWRLPPGLPAILNKDGHLPRNSDGHGNTILTCNKEHD
jgi:glycosyltransferase involved in cell wall biosynthesis